MNLLSYTYMFLCNVKQIWLIVLIKDGFDTEIVNFCEESECDDYVKEWFCI